MQAATFPDPWTDLEIPALTKLSRMGEKNKPTNGFMFLAFLLYNFFFHAGIPPVPIFLLRFRATAPFPLPFYQGSRLYNRKRHFPKTSAFLFQIQTGSPNKFHCCVSPRSSCEAEKFPFIYSRRLSAFGPLSGWSAVFRIHPSHSDEMKLWPFPPLCVSVTYGAPLSLSGLEVGTSQDFSTRITPTLPKI